jgi:2-oxoisovalerate dehydrogenase E1 component
MFDTYRTALRGCGVRAANRQPVFLHVKTVRLFGHAGSDVEAAYRAKAEIEHAEENDPLVHSAAPAGESRLSRARCGRRLAIYSEIAKTCEAQMEKVIARPRLKTAGEVMASLVPPKRVCAPANGPSGGGARAAFGGD